MPKKVVKKKKVNPKKAVVHRELNPKQEMFCKLYASDREFFGNGTQSYIEAYNPPKTGNWYLVARSRASELLTNPNVLRRINELLELQGLNDSYVDKQLELLITQNADFKAKIAAIREYNALKKRIVNKLDLSGMLEGKITFVDNLE
jgi:phage terminase small subunit